jgi:hypothetical protein
VITPVLTKHLILATARPGDSLGVLMDRFEPRVMAVRLVGELIREGCLTLTAPRKETDR